MNTKLDGESKKKNGGIISNLMSGCFLEQIDEDADKSEEEGQEEEFEYGNNRFQNEIGKEMNKEGTAEDIYNDQDYILFAILLELRKLNKIMEMKKK